MDPLISINKAVLQVPVLETHLPLNEKRQQEIRDEIVSRARGLWGDAQEVECHAQWRPAPGFYPVPCMIAVFTLTKVEPVEEFVEAEVME